MFSRKRITTLGICLVCSLGVLFFCNGLVPTASASQPKKIAVVDFSSEFQDTGQGIADMLVVELVKNKKFEVIERQQLYHVLKEQGLDTSGAIESNVTKLGKLMGIDYLVFGSVAGIDANATYFLGIAQAKITATLTMRLVDATTGKIIFAESSTGTQTSTAINIQGVNAGNVLTSGAGRKATLKALKPLVDKINDLHPTEGAVIKLEGNKVYIDIGVEHGAQKGQVYETYLEKTVYHPVTGEVVGVERIKTGEIKLTGAYSGMSVGKGEGKIQQGHSVRLAD